MTMIAKKVKRRIYTCELFVKFGVKKFGFEPYFGAREKVRCLHMQTFVKFRVKRFYANHTFVFMVRETFSRIIPLGIVANQIPSDQIMVRVRTFSLRIKAARCAFCIPIFLLMGSENGKFCGGHFQSKRCKFFPLQLLTDE
jgi:hypothetical protein